MRLKSEWEFTGNLFWAPNEPFKIFLRRLSLILNFDICFNFVHLKTVVQNHGLLQIFLCSSRSFILCFSTKFIVVNFHAFSISCWPTNNFIISHACQPNNTPFGQFSIHKISWSPCQHQSDGDNVVSRQFQNFKLSFCQVPANFFLNFRVLRDFFL